MVDQGSRLIFTNLLAVPDGDIRFKLDKSVLPKEVPLNPEITGWVVHRKHKISEVFLTSGSEVLATAKLDIFRPLVSQHFSRFYNSESAGFKLAAKTYPKNKFFLHIRLESGNTVTIAEFQLAACHQRKLLFMHIAKAAGSTVNSFLTDHYSEGQYAVHIESNKKWQSSPDELKKLSFLSGHVGLFDFEKKLDLEDYFKVAVVREPFSQLCSHLAWIKRLSMPGEEHRLKRHAAVIQTFAMKLSTIKYSDPAAVKQLLDSLAEIETRLVDNFQVRYFTRIPRGQTVGEADAQKAIEATMIFDKIGTTESIGNFMKDVAHEMSWPEPDDVVRENVTQDFYGLDLSNAKTRAVLRPLVQHDLALYEHIKTTLAP